MGTRAIVLAAGQGLRLRPLTDEIPKGLVPFRGRPMLERALESLGVAGVRDVTVVTGWRSERVTLGTRRRKNEEFATTNMIWSLFCADDVLAEAAERGEDVLIVYSDIVFAPALVSTLVASTAEFSVLIDRQWRRLWELRMPDPLADAETLKLGPGNVVREIGKKPRSYDEIEGQFVGLYKMSSRAIARVRALWHDVRAGKVTSAEGKTLDPRRLDSTTFLQTIADRVLPVTAVFADGGWLEVDSLADLEAYERHAVEITARLGLER